MRYGKLLTPEEIIVGGNNDGTLLWKQGIPEYKEINRLLCGQCELEQYADEFLENGDLPQFRNDWRQGIIQAANHDTTPWSPVLFEIITGDIGEYHDTLEEYYHKMRRYYNRVVAVQDRSTP